MIGSAGADAGALPPVARQLTVERPGAEAFAAFAEQIGQWWPSDFTASGENLADVTIEPKEGGRVYETNNQGKEYDWGSVLTYEPGQRVVLSWTLGLDGGSPTEVEAVFTGDDERCEVAFEHRGFDADQEMDRMKFDDEGGWNVVLEDYIAYAER